MLPFPLFFIGHYFIIDIISRWESQAQLAFSPPPSLFLLDYSCRAKISAIALRNRSDSTLSYSSRNHNSCK